jgi:hypothetical protein
MDYTPFDKMSDAEYLFRTGRGSTYAHLPGSQTVRNRSGVNHSDTSTGLQPKSSKTLYMDEKAVRTVSSYLQDPTTATKLVPEIGKDGKPTGYAVVQMMEDVYVPASKYGPEIRMKAGQTVSRVPFSLQPKQGMYPVEILGSSESPKGSKATSVHFGNTITEVIPRGGSGGVSMGRGTVGTPAQIGAGGGANIRNLNLQRLMAGGGAVKMPESYSDGSWKLI